jgi:Bacterial Ig domain
MKVPQLKILSVAIALTLAAGAANAALERVGPISSAPSIGGFPAWFQDQTGLTLEFCDLKNQAELDKGWCVLIPPGLAFPETFPNSFFGEHFYYAADNGLKDLAVGGGFRARLVVAVEAGFSTGAVIDGNQMTFGRHRIFLPTLPFDGDYRVITPFSDTSYLDQKAGDRIFKTIDVGPACIGTFECTLGTVIGPYLLPSPVAGGPEVPPMPDLRTAPAGTDPFYDLLAAPTADPGTNKQYLADPARIGPVTGSPLPDFIANNLDGSTGPRNHNTFRIEVRAPDVNHNGAVIYVIDGENNFTTHGRLMTAAIPGQVSVERASYKADGAGNITDLDVFAAAFPTVQARVPTQPQSPAVTPILSFYDVPCAGAIGVDGSGFPIINPPPYTAPVGNATAMAPTDNDFWGQSHPVGAPPSHVCVQDVTARNAAGQVVPAYYLKNVADDVTISRATFNGPGSGTLTVNAVSSDPTATLTLASYGPAPAATPGVISTKGAGTGLTLAGGVATVSSLLAPPARAQIVSSKGGAALLPVITASGEAVLVGIPTAVNDSATVFEDCSATAALACAPGLGVVVDLLANDTVLFDGSLASLRTLADGGLVTVVVTAQAPRLGIANVVNGVLTYTPNANVSGADSITYTVSVNGNVSNQAALAINITPVNDAPVAVNDLIDAVAGRANSFNLIAKATDPDGNTDVKTAVIVSWPVGLGPQPVPVNGVISYTPLAASVGPFNVTYRATDASGLLSLNTATSIVTVKAAEAITFTKSIFVGAGKVGGVTTTRWTVSGADTVKEGQTLSIGYNSGVTKTGVNCATTPANPTCLIGTAVVDSAGNYLFDKVGTPGGLLDPNDAVTWPTKPGTIRVYSSAPVLGGLNTTGISFK